MQFGMKEFVQGVVLLLVTVTVIQALTPTILAIDITRLPAWLQPIVEALQYIVVPSRLAVIWGFTWSFFGFCRYYYGDRAVKYEVKRLVDTLLWFEGLLLLFKAGLPPDQAIVLSTVIMALKALINRLRDVIGK